VLEKIGIIPQAIQAYQQAIALEPQWLSLTTTWVIFLLSAGAIDQAESIYVKRSLPIKSFWYLNLGNVLMEREQFDEAVETYIKALHLKPRDLISL